MVKKCKDHNIKRLNEEVYPYVERMLWAIPVKSKVIELNVK
jgi:hypothetical protein